MGEVTSEFTCIMLLGILYDLVFIKLKQEGKEEDGKGNRCYVPPEIYNEWIKYRPIANAGVAVVNPKKEVLILKRNIGSTEGEWELSGGGICMCELPKQTAIRELKEETGIEVKICQLQDLITVPAFHPGDRTDIVVTFLAYLDDNNPPITLKSGEHSEYKWVSLGDKSIKNYPMNEATREQIKTTYDFVFQSKETNHD